LKDVRTLVFVGACLLILGGAGSFAARWLSGVYLWRQAQHALDDRDFDRARASLRDYLQLRPRDAAAHFALARACRRADDLDAWEEHLQAARGLGHSIEEVRLEEMLELAQSGALRQVEAALLGRLNEQSADDGLVLEALAKGYLRDYRLTEAVRLTQQWQARYPQTWQPRFYRGQAYEVRGLYDLAEAEYRAALEVGPDRPEIHLALAGACLSRPQYQEALENFRAYMRRRPRSPAVLYGIASCQRGLGQPSAACATLEELFAQQPEHGPGLLLRGKLALEDGRAEEALGWLRRAERVLPQEPEVLTALVQALRLLGQDGEAEQVERRLERVHNQSEQLRLLKEEVPRRPDDVSLRQQAGSILLELGRTREALRWLLSALQIDPHNRPTHAALAACYERLNDPGRAQDHRRQAEEPAAAPGGRK
jgi:tetratricopeptide (TPR) repeat protein